MPGGGRVSKASNPTYPPSVPRVIHRGGERIHRGGGAGRAAVEVPAPPLAGGASTAAPGRLGGPHPGPRAGGRGALGQEVGRGLISRSPCGRAGPAPPLRLRLTAALPRHRSPRAVPSARSPWARSPVRHPLSPGRAVRSKPWGSIRGGRELQGRRPRLRPIRASVPTGVLGWWTSSECHCGPGSGRSWRASRLSADARGVGAPARPRTARRGLPAQRGRGRFGGRRCTRDRRHTRPVRPVRLGAGAGGSVAE